MREGKNMKFRKMTTMMLSAMLVVGSVITTTPGIIMAGEGDSSEISTEGARTADDVQNNRCYINGDEVRAYKTDDGVYVYANDLVAYGFSVVSDGNSIDIEWAGTDYYFDETFSPDTDDESMPEGVAQKAEITGTIAGESADIYVIDGNTVVEAEDLGRFGYVEYNDEKEITNIYVEAAGYSQNEENYRNVVVDASEVTGKIKQMNGGHYDPEEPGTEKNDNYKSAGIISVRTHDIDGTGIDGRGIIYNIVPGYFDLYSALKYIPTFMDELTAAAEEAGKKDGNGEMPAEDWLADARLADTEENENTGEPANLARTEKINEIIENDAYAYSMEAMETYMEECKAALDEIDVTDEQYYNFEELDKVIDNILSLNATVFFRFGASQNDLIDNTFPELGTEEWETYKENLAKIAVKICDHYMSGWNSDKDYENVLSYFEIWNEPDLLDFWPNEPEQYYEMYEAVTKAVKAAYPELPVGGPAITTENDDRGTKEGFLEYVVANDCPLDFYSYHFYPTNNVDGYDYTRWAFSYENLLASYGFEDIPIILSEYGTALFSQFSEFIYNEGRDRIHLLNNSIYLQDSPVILDYAYGSVSDVEFGNYAAFTTMAQFYETSERLAVSGSDKNGFAVLAGRNEEKINIVISNYEIPAEQMLRNYAPENPNPVMDGNKFSIPGVANWTLPVARVLTYENNAGYNLTVNNIPFDADEVVVETYRVDSDSVLELVNTVTLPVTDGVVEISSELATYTADLLVITAK